MNAWSVVSLTSWYICQYLSHICGQRLWCVGKVSVFETTKTNNTEMGTFWMSWYLWN